MSLFVVQRLDEVPVHIGPYDLRRSEYISQGENLRAGPHKVVLCTGTDVSSWWGGCQLTYCLVRLHVVVDL